MTWWKFLLSYLFELLIEQRKDLEGEPLTVTLYQGRYKLNRGQATYSFEEFYTSFGYAFRAIRLDKRRVNKVLVLGFGLGSIPVILEQHYDLRCPVVGIEYDPVVIELAGRYGKFNKENVQIIEGRAETFSAYLTEKFDLICVDVFLGTEVPSSILTREFTLMLKDHLSPSGVVLFSFLPNTKEQEYRKNRYFREHFIPVFPKGLEILTPNSNVALFNGG